MLAKRQAEELEAQRVLEEKRRIAEEARLRAEEEQRLAEEARRRVEEERRLLEEARLRAEQEYKLRKAQEEAELRRAEEEERRRIAAEETRRLHEEAARIQTERLALEEELRLEQEKLEQIQRAKLAAEKARAEAAARREVERLAAEEAARLQAEAEEQRMAEEEEQQRQAVEAARLAAEEEARRKAEEEARLEAARLAAEKAAHIAAAEAARLTRLAEIEAALKDAKRQEEELLAKRAAELKQFAETTAEKAARVKQEKEAALKTKLAWEQVELVAARAEGTAKLDELARAGKETALRTEAEEKELNATMDAAAVLANEGDERREQQQATLDKWHQEKEEKKAILLENMERARQEAIQKFEQERDVQAAAAMEAKEKLKASAAKRKKEERNLAAKQKNKDQLDGEVQKLMEKVQSTVQLVRLRSGTYLIKGTTKKIFVRILNSIIMVRVGGGWQKLEEWLAKHKPQLDDKSKSAAKRRLDSRMEKPISGAEDATLRVASSTKRVNKDGSKIVTKKVGAADTAGADDSEALPPAPKGSRKPSESGDVLLVGTSGNTPDVDAFSQQEATQDAHLKAKLALDEQSRIVEQLRKEEEELLKQADTMSNMDADNIEDLEAQILQEKESTIKRLDDLANQDLDRIRSEFLFAEQQHSAEEAEIAQKGEDMRQTIADARAQHLVEEERRQELQDEIMQLDEAKKAAIASLETSTLAEVKATVAELEATRQQREQEHQEWLVQTQQEFRDKRAALEAERRQILEAPALGDDAFAATSALEVASDGVVPAVVSAVKRISLETNLDDLSGSDAEIDLDNLVAEGASAESATRRGTYTVDMDQHPLGSHVASEVSEAQAPAVSEVRSPILEDDEGQDVVTTQRNLGSPLDDEQYDDTEVSTRSRTRTWDQVVRPSLTADDAVDNASLPCMSDTAAEATSGDAAGNVADDAFAAQAGHVAEQQDVGDDEDEYIDVAVDDQPATEAAEAPPARLSSAAPTFEIGEQVQTKLGLVRVGYTVASCSGCVGACRTGSVNGA